MAEEKDKTTTPAFQRTGIAQVVDTAPTAGADTPPAPPKTQGDPDPDGDLPPAAKGATDKGATEAKGADPAPAFNIEDTPEYKALKAQQEQELEEAKQAFVEASKALEQAKIAQERAQQAYDATQAQAQGLVADSQAELEKAKELQENAQHALEVAKFVEPRGLNNLPAVPALADSPIYKDLTPNVPTPVEIEANFLALLEKALNEEGAWKEQIYLCLQGVSRILMAFKGLKSFYENAQSALADAGNALESRSAFFNAQIQYLQQILSDYNRYFDEFNAVMNENNALINQNFNVVLDQIELVKKLLGRASTEGQALLSYQNTIKALLAKLNSMDDLKNQLLELHTKSRVFIDEIKRLIQEAITSIQEQQDQAINHITTQEQESITKILALQQQIEEALNNLEQEGIQHLQEQLAKIQEQIDAFNLDYTKKLEQIQGHTREVVKIRDFLNALEKAMIQEADQKLAAMENVGQTQLDAYNDNAQKQTQAYNDNAQAQLDAFNANDELKTRTFNNNARRLEESYNTNADQLKNDYTNNAAQLKQDFNANASAQTEAYDNNTAQSLEQITQTATTLTREFSDNAKAKLDEYNANDQVKTLDYNTNAQTKVGEYNDNINNKIADFDNHAHDKVEESKIAIEALADDLIAKMAIAGTPLHTELGGIHKLLDDLTAKQFRFGANFQVVEVANNQQWSAPVDAIYYYVFIQGGNTAMGSNQNGGVTSFGALLSANGGFNGQRGECKAGWFNLQAGSTHNITVGTGGICVISYATRL